MSLDPSAQVDPVIQTVPLAEQWPTVDPFLFCAHHVDHYPSGNDQMGPDASLQGRNIGMDFEGIDGWRMYHGSIVPGFPQHPHRGFETVTFVRHGYVDHSDSLGAQARFGRGDVQWLTAGSGVVHSEMIPILDREQPNSAEFFQIWLNLPAANKMVNPDFTMLWEHTIPRHISIDDGGRATNVTVIAGTLEDNVPPPPPINSWAAQPESDVAIWHLSAEANASWTIPAAGQSETVRTLYVFEGSAQIGQHDLVAAVGTVLHANQPVDITAGPAGYEAMILQGRPIDEPVARYGPFVMNQESEIQQAFADYRRTQFGGWPWPTPDPVHDRERGRFARHADGRVDHVDALQD
ncbi:MAG: pirin family protein [Actinomycetes bacterium]